MDAARDFAIFAVEPDGTILTWNPGVKNITGYDEHEFVGGNCEMLFTPEDREAGAPEHERETARREGLCLDERWHLRKDGERFWGSGYMHALRDERGGLVGFAKIVRDMTAQKRYEEDLKERVRAHTRSHVEAQRQMLTVQEDERRRISRELHDSTGQHLAALGIELGLLDQTADTARSSAARAARTAGEAARLATQAAQDSEAAHAAAQSGTAPEAARLSKRAADAARTAAGNSAEASADASAADASLAVIQETEMGLARLRALNAALSQDLHRLALDLRPTSLDDLGLVAALRAYAENCAAARAGAEVVIESVGLDGAAGGRLSAEVETVLYRIVQEALTNAAKYAVPGGATRVSVMLQRVGATALATVEDDGPGFDVEAAARKGRLGLAGMQERAALLGGSVEVESSPGKGTTVYARIPLPEAPSS